MRFTSSAVHALVAAVVLAVAAYAFVALARTPIPPHWTLSWSSPRPPPPDRNRLVPRVALRAAGYVYFDGVILAQVTDEDVTIASLEEKLVEWRSATEARRPLSGRRWPSQVELVVEVGANERAVAAVRATCERAQCKCVERRVASFAAPARWDDGWPIKVEVAASGRVAIDGSVVEQDVGDDTTVLRQLALSLPRHERDAARAGRRLPAHVDLYVDPGASEHIVDLARATIERHGRPVEVHRRAYAD